jgi:phosphoribosylformylglycinamidine synthase PurS subunit
VGFLSNNCRGIEVDYQSGSKQPHSKGSADFRALLLIRRKRGEIKMLAKVYVTLKNGVLDPQGKAIHHAAETIGYQGIADVRQGKYFEIKLDESVDESSARAEIEKFARDVLSNPVIEDYRVEIFSEQ